MTLLEDLTEYGEDMGYPEPENDLENVTKVSDEIVDSGRWCIIHQAVYQRSTVVTLNPLTFNHEYVMMTYREPATENQDWGDEGPPDLYEVVPVEKTVIQFVRKE